ncbi:Mediator of RNA polymerase II transcription subunit [Sesamum angolense]|uniref:Mediator of RNA polymerase II transcription subunit n=1 Tax=Sesamum angolense TaxID=2727404 RepID=A0AAE1WUW2_9LAMI|nr:Mediator of RNA polymerase II transcription subunit [Sesamum angolense]
MQQAAAPPANQDATAAGGDAPPKQVAQALEQLGQAGRLIADVRLGADRLLEALFYVAEEPHHQHSAKCLNLILKEESLMRQHLQNLSAIGGYLCVSVSIDLLARQLEESGVLNDSLRSRSNSWGLHMPLVCPDGAVVAYAWKRQLAGQAGASAVDRTRLALKAFTDQKRRFFPHLAEDSVVESAMKKHCSPLPISQEELADQKTLADILSHLEKEVPNLQAFTYQRLDWLKRASSLPSAANESSTESSKEHSFPSTSKWVQGSISMHAPDKAAVIELLLPSVFRAVVSLHTAGSMDPDAVAFFSPDEEHASMALQYFTCANPETALHSLLLSNIVHESLQPLLVPSEAQSRLYLCSKCGKLLSMDKQSGLILPPVKRPFRYYTAGRKSAKSSTAENCSMDLIKAFHISCFSEEA